MAALPASPPASLVAIALFAAPAKALRIPASAIGLPDGLKPCGK